MRRQLTENVWIGDERECFHDDKEEWAVVHACKSPCHQRALGYRGSLSSDHPNYLTHRRGWHLYLNIIDPPIPLFKIELFEAFIRFAREADGDGRHLLIHCNQGQSRAPSLGLLHMATVSADITAQSYEQAVIAYREVDPYYAPGRGIQRFLSENWDGVTAA